MSTVLTTEAMRRRGRLAADKLTLCVLDVQERLVAAMPPEVATRMIRNTVVLIEAAARLGFRIVATEQYPKGLGPTVPPVEAALSAAVTAGADVVRFEKLHFSAAATPQFAAIRTRAGAAELRDQWIVCGMETHVCVYQTARDLMETSAVHVVADAVCSRTKANWRIGLELARQLGAAVTSTEVCVFDLLGRADGEDFKALSKAIK